MGWLTKFNIRTLLDRERPLLDQIFGEGEYEIESTDPHEASVRSSRIDLKVEYNTRDRSIGSLLTIIEPWGEELDTTYGWARFMGEELPPLPRNRSGHITLSPEEQIRAELRWLARLATEVFSDPQKTRDAVNFVRGYRAAYNDRYDGVWGD